VSDQAGYPVGWEADVVLRDGTTTHVRPIRPEDADALQRFQLGQSERSSYFRFFAPVRRLTERELERFTRVDHVDRAALVAVRASPQSPGGEDIIGVARYDVVEPGLAEVAFNVSDSVQGVGLGSVLLEHLAAAARERGLRRFTADVLPQNGGMLGVFREAGYAVRQKLDDGVVTVSVDLDPTDRSRQVMADREHRAEARSMQALLAARRVLLVGPGPDVGAPGWQGLALVAQRVLDAAAHDPGDTELFVLDPPGPVRQNATRLAGWGAVPAIDLVMLALPAPDAVAAVRRLAGAGARGVVVLSAGFAEVGPQGLELQRELLRVAHGLGMRVVGPASWGIVSTAYGAGLRASLAEAPPAEGVVGLFCQSAPAAVTLAATLSRRGLGASAIVSAGHRADVSGNDVMQYWLTDPGTTVVCLYLESIGNPRKFTRVARRLATEKPVGVVVAGRSGQVVPPGHAVRATHAPRAMLDAMLRPAGVIRADNTHPLIDIAQVLAHQPLPRGRRVGILASSSALAVLVAEAAAAQGLVVASSSDYLAPERSPDDVERVVDALYAEDACDAVVVVDVPVVMERGTHVARAVARAAARTGRTTVVSMIGLHGMPDELAASADDGTQVRVPAYSTPEDAVAALAKVVSYAQWRERDHGAPVEPAGIDRRAARRLVEAALAGVGEVTGQPEATVTLDQDAAAELLGCYGLTVFPVRRARTVGEAVAAARELGWPVAIKTASPTLRHRTDLGGVRVDIDDPEELAEAVERMRAVARDAGLDPLLEVQRMAPAGVAVRVRTAEDPLFGPTVSFGLAGDATDLLGDVASGVAPLTDVDVRELVRAVRAAPRLFGYQGAPLADVAGIEDVVARVSVMADDLPELAALDLHPVLAAEHGVSVLHASVRLSRTIERRDPLRRALPG
jgi:acyl-CoA synthetase (NDP forming)/RimJ/RimL family protein N-acetyltransferase